MIVPPGYWTLYGLVLVLFVGLCVTAINGAEMREGLKKQGDVIVILAEELARVREGK